MARNSDIGSDSLDYVTQDECFKKKDDKSPHDHYWGTPPSPEDVQNRNKTTARRFIDDYKSFSKAMDKVDW